jgi:hypothetical protein
MQIDRPSKRWLLERLLSEAVFERLCRQRGVAINDQQLRRALWRACLKYGPLRQA